MRRTGYQLDYTPITVRPPISFRDHQTATCSNCTIGEWLANSKTQYSPCCHAMRVGHGVSAKGNPQRHPFRQPIPGDRLSVRGGATWREVIRVVDGIVVYLTGKCREECQCTLHSWEEWGFGRTRANGRCPARVEKRGDA